MASRLGAVLCFLVAWPAALAAAPKTAVFPFELIDSSYEGQVNGVNPDETRRVEMVSVEEVELLKNDGRYQLVDLSGLAGEIKKDTPLNTCNGCAVDIAKKAGADLAITGTVQKVSNLILNLNLYISDVATGTLKRSLSVDIRGNTDESWMRGVRWLVRNQLFAEDGSSK